MATKTNKLRAEFGELQSRAQAKAAAHREFSIAMRLKYGQYRFGIRKSEANRLERLDAADTKAQDAFFAWLDEHSPRCWRSHAPACWIVEELTFDDAVSDGQLATIPPCAWGYAPSDMVRFSAPVRSEFVLA